MDQAIIFSKGYITPENVATMLGLLDPNQLETIFTAILSGNKSEMLGIIKELESYECEIVIDELIAYLKNAFFAQDRRFSTLLYERFFKILSEAKSLLYINANNGFVLSLIFFKMIEATNIKTIEEMIDSLENEKFRLPATAHAKTETSEVAATPAEEEETSLHVKDQGVTSEMLFARLCDKLLDRNAELGDCFKQYTHFNSFTDGQLMLSSSAEGEASKTLNTNYSIIKHFVQELFGLETKIKITKRQVLPPEPKPEPSFDPNDELQMSEAELSANDQSASMIESIEFEDTPQSDSCVAGAIMAGQREIDAKEVLNTPFVQRATELFDPQKIQIHQKI
jgi:DNA polymerase-3 subunit gamma/tau